VQVLLKYFLVLRQTIMITKKPSRLHREGLSFRGGDRIRTGVQTHSTKAFYMFIPALIVGEQQEPDEPIIPLAEWS